MTHGTHGDTRQANDIAILHLTLTLTLIFSRPSKQALLMARFALE